MSGYALILAAGQGTRMKSSLPKVAHELLEKPLINWVIDSAERAGCTNVCCVLGHGKEIIEPLVSDCETAVQEQQLGTGHAVMCARSFVERAAAEGESLIVLSGDSPLIKPCTIATVLHVRETRNLGAVVLTMTPPNNYGYGRIITDDNGDIEAIVEQKDCNAWQAAITTCNSGIYCFDAKALLEQLSNLSTNNSQGEYYLTDVIELMREAGLGVSTVHAEDYTEALGINTRVQLAEASAIMQKRINTKHMENGVTMLDPTLVWIGPDVEIENDVEILPMSFLFGKMTVPSGTVIGPNVRVSDGAPL